MTTNQPTGVIGTDERDVVFISYSRTDAEAVRLLVEQLQRSEVRVWIDVSDIRPATDWMAEIREGITNARAVVVLLSPAYLASPACGEELDHAHEHGKAIVPVLVKPVDMEAVPAWLKALHWIPGQAGADPVDVCGRVAQAVSTDVVWADFHARLLTRAGDWARRSKPNSMLLRGKELEEAERELGRVRPLGQPTATPAQADFVTASRGHQRRTSRRFISAAAVVTVLSLTLAAVAFWQRQEANRSAEQARQALAASDYERLSAGVGTAPDMTTRARLALGAYSAASAAGLADSKGVNTLIGALAADGIPIATFGIRADNQQYTGDHLGVAVSGDGSTLAYVSLTGELRIVDLWTMNVRSTVDLGDIDYQGLVQVALDFDGSHTLVALGDLSGAGLLRVYDVTDLEPVLEVDEQLAYGDDLAATAFGPRPGVYLFVRVSGEILVAGQTGDLNSLTVLGQPVLRTSAGTMEVTFSLDGNRVCRAGEASGVYQVEPATQLAFNTQVGCIPEECAGSVSNHLEWDEFEYVCVDPSGGVIGPVDDCAKCDRSFGRFEVPGPTGDRVVLVTSGILEVRDSARESSLPVTQAELPFEGTAIVSAVGQPLAVLQGSGEVYFPDGRGAALTPDPQLVVAAAIPWGAPTQLLTDGSLAWESDGSVHVLGAGPGATTTITDEVAAAAWNRDFVAVATTTGVEVWDARTGTNLAANTSESPLCELGWSLGGTALAGVHCSDGAVSSWRFDGARLAFVTQQPNPLPRVGGVTVSDDGTRFAVTQSFGQTVVWNGEGWVQDAVLQSEAYPTNSYKPGMSVMSGDGAHLLVRKNGEGVTLWSVDDQVTMVATLTTSDPVDGLTVTEFTDTTITLAWAATDSQTMQPPQMISWDVSEPTLVRTACSLEAATSVATSLADQTVRNRYANPCLEFPVDRADAPEVTAPPVATAEPTDSTSELVLHDLTTLQIATEAQPLVIASSGGAIVDVVGSQIAVVDLRTMELLRTEPLTDGQPVRFAVADGNRGDLYVSFACDDVYRVDLDGVAHLLTATDGTTMVACDAIAFAGDALWSLTFRDGGRFEAISVDGQHLSVPIPEWATGDVAALVTCPDGLVRALVVPFSEGPAALLTLDPVALTVDAVEVADATGPIAADQMGTSWLAASGRIITRSSDGTQVSTAVNDVGPIRSMVVDTVGRLWFTTDTSIGMMMPDSIVMIAPVPGAKHLGGLTFSATSSQLVALDADTGTLYRFSIAAA